MVHSTMKSTDSAVGADKSLPHSSEEGVISLFSKEYEELFHAIQLQLEKCKNEQDNLRGKLKSVAVDNCSAVTQLEAEMTNRIPCTKEEVLECLNGNIKEQLDCAIQEKDSAIEMWQTALQLVTALENELQSYRDNTHLTSAMEQVKEVRGEYSKAISLLEDKLSVSASRFSKEKAAREEAERQLVHIKSDYEQLNERYEKRVTELDKALVAQQAAIRKAEELEKNTRCAEMNAKEATLSCTELEAALEQSVARLQATYSREVEAQEKVDEAIQIVEAALIERDSAIKEAAEAKDEAKRLRGTICELITEAGTQVQAEAEQIKDLYNARIKTILLDMRRLHDENKSKGFQLQKLRSDMSNMEEELRRTKRDLETALRDRPSLSALDRKIEGLFRVQELAGGEALRAELEQDHLKAEIVKLTQSQELDKRQWLLERHSLEEQVRALQGELESAACTVSDVSARAEMLALTLRQRDYELNSLKKALSTSFNVDPTSHKGCDLKSKAADEFHTSMKENQLLQELQSQLDGQRKLAQKWKDEVNTITSRFQSRVRELRSEASALRRENYDLHNQLQVVKYQNQVDQSMGTNGFSDKRLRGHTLKHEPGWSSSSDSFGRLSL